MTRRGRRAKKAPNIPTTDTEIEAFERKLGKPPRLSKAFIDRVTVAVLKRIRTETCRCEERY